MRDNPNCILKETELCKQMGGECTKCDLGSMDVEKQEKLRKIYDDRDREKAQDTKTEKKAGKGKDECYMKDTELCKKVAYDCEKCEIKHLKPDAKKKMMETYETIQRLLPKGGLTPLTESETCLLCKDGEHRKRTCYATFDMAHEEPKGTKRMVIGLKVKQKVGSIVTASIACCRRCHMLHIVKDMVFALCVAVFTVVGLLGLLVESMRLWLNGGGTDMLMPFIWCAVFVIAGLVAGHFIKKAVTNAFSKSVVMDMNEIPQIREMREKGWFFMAETDGGGKQRLLFLRKPEKSLIPTTAANDDLPIE